MHLQKLINAFYKKYLEKLITIFLLLDFALAIARLTVLKQQPKSKLICQYY